MRSIYYYLNKIINRIQARGGVKNYPHIHPTAYVSPYAIVSSPEHLIMEENTNIYDDSQISNGEHGEFIMKKNSGAARGLVVLCGNHLSLVGYSFKQVTEEKKNEIDVNHKCSQPVVVDEDVWIGIRCILLSGCHIGRGAIIGAGSVVRGNIPPYAMVIGNPAKVVGFRFNLEEQLEHERKLYPENERLSVDLLDKNYNKYFLNRMKEIREYTRLYL